MQYPNRYTVTAALPYANGPLHIGHLSGCYIAADVYVRFLRLMGKDVLFICGSDEHGAAITLRAAKEGKSPKEIIDKYHKIFEKAFEGMAIDFDVYHRTSDQLHHETSQDFFRTLYKQGSFTEKETEQYYDVDAGQFLADRYISGTCPNCSYEEAYGDQCENCGSTLSPTELIKPKSTLTGSTPILRKTSHWYLPLDKYEDWLRDYIEKGELDGKEHHDVDAWKNHVVGQCKSWLDSGLKERAMTRDLDWGVDVPQEIDGSEGKKLYVWMDAPIGYISATKYWAENQGNPDAWKTWWQDDDSALIHFIGKDNIVFHCLIFPALLKEHGGFVLPVNVPANQFMNLEGKKISTSKNWAVWVHEYLEDYPDRQDELRYTLVRNMPELKDSEFTWAGFQENNNNELVNNLANFINRVLVLTQKYYEGKVPEIDEDHSIVSATDEHNPSFFDSEMLDLFDEIQNFCDAMRRFDFRAAQLKMMDISGMGNQLLQFNEPWKLVKEDPETTKVVLVLGLQYITALSVIMDIFLPFSSAKLRKMLNLATIDRSDTLLECLNDLAEGNHLIPAGHQIGKSEHLFTRISDEEMDKQREKLVQMSQEASSNHSPIKEEVSYDEFVKMDIRTATILEAERVPKTDKLLRLKLDLGFEERTVVSGIAKDYRAEEIIGQEVLLLANLAPRKIRGIESKGMILMAENEEGKLCFVAPGRGWGKGYTVS